jgi:hypothetical protein
MRGAGRVLVVLGTAAAFSCSNGSNTTPVTGVLQVSSIPDFGHVMLARDARVQVQARNLGRAPLTITSVDLSVPGQDYRIEGDAVGRLAAGQSLHFTVVFAPQALGVRVSRIAFHNDGTNPLKTADLSGTGILGEADFEPKALDFGDVGLGSSYTLPITFTNLATDPAAVQVSAVSGADAASFTASASGALSVAPTGTLTLNVTFRPNRMGPHTASLQITPCPSCATQTVPLTGIGIAADLTATPSPLDFGVMAPLQTATKAVTVTNLGTRPVTISPAVLDTGTNPAFTVAPTGTVVLMQNQTEQINVTFAVPQTGTYSGALRIPTDDTGTPVMIVPLMGTGAGPAIAVDPTALGFPHQGVGLAVSKQIAVRNVGLDPTNMNPLVISNLTITAGPFTVSNMTNPTPITIPVGREQYIWITYAPTVAGQDMGTLTIANNDPLRPMVNIPITGSASVLPPCTYNVVPPNLDFGSVDSGTTAQLFFEIQNTGSTECGVGNIQLSAATPDVFAMNQISSRLIAPGAVLLVPVEFTPNGPGSWAGEVDFDVLSGTAPNGTVPLTGNGVPTCFQVTPNPLDFGTVGLSCTSPTKSVQLNNTCATAVNVTNSYVGMGPSTAFTLNPASAGAMTIAPGGQALLPVTYGPTAAGTDEGVLYVQTDFAAAPYSVALTGQAVGQLTNTDTYTLPPIQKVDVLWVVDNSGSMSNKQAQLSANAGAFIQAAVNSGVDFHIAITTTGITPFTGGIAQCPGGADGGEAGRFFPVDDSAARILTNMTPNVGAVFSQNVLVGICHYIEEGFIAMQLALSPPLITSAKAPGTPFPADGNLGFLRPDARLYIIWVTDEDDVVPDPSSPLGKSPNPVPVQNYVDFLYSLKPGRPDMVSASAAVALPNSCGGNYDGVGKRYMQLVGQLGGVIADICSPDWNGVIQQFAQLAFAPQLDFPLTQPAQGRNPTVTVNGNPVPATGANGQTNWHFDPTIGDNGAVVFDPSDSPGPSSTVTITYPVPCPMSP